MTIYDRSLVDKIPKQDQKAIRYYPDMIPYKHDQPQFQRHWQILCQANYIYCDGILIKPVGWFRFAFESVKGMLGLTNHCHKSHVRMGLMKLAYYGYVHEFLSDQPNHHKYPLAKPLWDDLKTTRCTKTSKRIQQHMVRFYTENMDYFPQDKFCGNIYSGYAFGKIMIRLEAYDVIPGLDPSDEILIGYTIKKMAEMTWPVKMTIPGSLFAKKAGEFFFKKRNGNNPGNQSMFKNIWDKIPKYLPLASSAPELDPDPNLTKAFDIYPDCAEKHPHEFIRHFCQTGELDKAWNIIQQYLKKPKDKLAYLRKEPFTTQFLQKHVKRNSDLGRALAEHFLKDNYQAENILIARQFYQNIHEVAPEHVLKFNTEQMQDLLKTHISNKDYEQALKVIKESHEKGIQLDAVTIETVADHCDALGERHYEIGKAHKIKGNWHKAKLEYARSSVAKKRAFEAEPTLYRKTVVYEHQRLYAQVLIAEQQSCPKTIEYENMVKAIQLLRKCHQYYQENDVILRESKVHAIDDEKKLIQKAFATGLMISADYLRRQCEMGVLHEDPKEKRKHLIKHHEKFVLICKQLQEIVGLLEGTDDPELKPVLAKACFNLADTLDFSDPNSSDASITEYFKQAKEGAPDNPVYCMRYAEQYFDREEYETLKAQADAMISQFNLTYEHYSNWKKQRWAREKISLFSIGDIHHIPKADDFNPSIGLSI